MPAPSVVNIPTTVATSASAGVASGDATDTLTVYYPSSVAVDDIAILLKLARTSTTQNLTDESEDGWTPFAAETVQVGSLGSLAARLYWRRCTGSEDGTSFTASMTTTGGGTALRFAQIATFSGCVASGTPYEGFTVLSNASNGTGAAATDTTVTSGSDRLGVRIFLFANDGQTGAVTGSWTRNSEISTTLASDATIAWDTKTIASATTEAATARDGATNYANINFAFALIPASGGGSVAPIAAYYQSLRNNE